MSKAHSFHIPVMGIGFTIDTPLKVSRFGIDSVIAIGNDKLLERLREMYCKKYDLTYKKIQDDREDCRAKRITSYLNLIKKLSELEFQILKSEFLTGGEQAKIYVDLLPKGKLKSNLSKILYHPYPSARIEKWIDQNLHMGNIDVNIMTKTDKPYYKGNTKLPIEYNGAHAMVRGFANSDLESSIVLSAGMNPKLFTYMENFSDFYPDVNGYIKKKITVKVSDYRSALIQGKMLAKRGLWVSEYRVESGLNCGGHAFATDGTLLGPILSDFKHKKNQLRHETFSLLKDALAAKNKSIPNNLIKFRISAQGGVGTSDEHEFLLQKYELDSVGWGTPFLLAPDVTNVDGDTLTKLSIAGEKDVYLSNNSPLGVPFYNLKNSSQEIEKRKRIEKGVPGSPCVNKYLAFNTEFTNKEICTASRKYQALKIKELDSQNLSENDYATQLEKVTQKECICAGLSTPAVLVNKLPVGVEGKGVSVCPGPNIAYFNGILSLKKITDHIYGKNNLFCSDHRPNMFIKELNIYVDYYIDKVKSAWKNLSPKKTTELISFADNLLSSVAYYNSLIEKEKNAFKENVTSILTELAAIELQLNNSRIDISIHGIKPNQ